MQHITYKKKIDNKILGIVWTLIHCFLITCISAFSKSLAKDYSVFQIIFLQNAISLILLFGWLYFTSNTKIRTNNFFLHFVRAFSNFIGLILYYHSLKFLPLIEVRAITLSSPIIKSILAVIILKESMNSSQGIGLFVGLIGSLIIVIQPTHYVANQHLLLVIGSVLAWAFSSVIIKMLGKNDSNNSQLFFFLLLSTVLSSITAIKFWTPINPDHIWILLILGIFYFINVAFTLEAYKYAEITLLMPFNFSTLVFTSIIAFLVYHEVPTLKTFIGSSIIFLSSLYVSWSQIKKSH